jgi:aminoglycoside phosphotransferase (APT) family kinase protein
MRVPQYAVPEGVRILRADRNRVAEVNTVFRCLGVRGDTQFHFYLKISKSPETNMTNERHVLSELHQYGFPVPKPLWHGRGRREFLAVEERSGEMLRDMLNPLSPLHDEALSYDLLEEFGELVGRLHTLPIEWEEQKRTALYGFLGEQELDEERFRTLVSWLRRNVPEEHTLGFVHGDLNDANVLVSDRRISAILDWESAGMGWREYELAWVLRERRNYMNTTTARQRFLAGYTTKASYNAQTLQWCEVMNAMHVAFWCKDTYPNFMNFNLQKAFEAIERDYDTPEGKGG